MDQSALVMQPIAAGMRFLEAFEKYAPVVVAFWIKGADDSRWNLYVASDQFDKGNLDVAYGEVLRIASQMNDPNFDAFQVKLVRLNEPAVQAALKYYRGRPPKIPVHFRGQDFEEIDAEEVYLVRGPTGAYRMSTGREVLDQIIDQEAEFFKTNGKSPSRMKLPVLMAYDLAKCGRDELGEISGRVFQDGITVFEKVGFHGMKVEINRDPNAALQLE